ncbi:MAG: hypothetical protein AMJ60_05780 [Desulfobacterales bacterium SG8_35]|nr:MAG: hypothetical protein AMJ60_05780 [Desulfobacterales bacterium SG8_35]
MALTAKARARIKRLRVVNRLAMNWNIASGKLCVKTIVFMPGWNARASWEIAASWGSSDWRRMLLR